jgi:hypothetical protein
MLNVEKGEEFSGNSRTQDAAPASNKLASCQYAGYSARMVSKRNRVSRILGIGNLPEDGILRKTAGDNFDLFLGDGPAHASMQGFCLQLNQVLDQLGLELSDLSAEQLTTLLRGLGAMEDSGCAS